MPSLPFRRAPALAFFVLTPLVTAAPQLDLPRKDERRQPAPQHKEREEPEQPRGNLVPHLVCSVCASRNYTTAPHEARERGIQQVYCGLCRRSTAHRYAAPGSGEGGELALPERREGIPRPPLAGAGDVTAPLPVTPGLEGERAAAYVFDEVRRTEGRIAQKLSPQAVETLLDLGVPGIEAARAQLRDPHPYVALTAARVLWRSGEERDGERVAQWLRTAVPARAGEELVAEFARLDPLRASDAFLVELLDHERASVRNGAFAELAKRMDSESLPAAAEALGSKRASTRERAVELIGGVDDPAVLDLLLTRLADPSAAVARGVVERLAVLEDGRVEVELLSRAFAERWVLRGAAYALLTLIRREEARGEPLLGESHVPTLLASMSASDPFVAGVCAAALAGIGYRSADPSRTPWLDRQVPEALVAAVSGQVYHDDFSSLQPLAEDRLRWLSGQDFGAVGARWVEWWLGTRETFYPHRAHMVVGDEDATAIRVRYSPSEDGRDVVLSGPDALAIAPTAGAERSMLSAAQCTSLVAALRHEGVFGAERLPGARGHIDSARRSLEVRVGSAGKEFVLGSGRREEWFERIVASVHEFAERNRWQRYLAPGEGVDPLGAWRAEAPWWDANQDEAIRAARLEALVLDHLRRTPARDRGAALAELEDLWRAPGVAGREDVAPLLAMLRDEPLLGDRGRALGQLVLTAADGDSSLVGEFIGAAVEQFEAQSSELVAAALGTLDIAVVREYLHDERAFVRVHAAAELAQRGTSEDDAALVALLEDPAVEVQLAAVTLIGERKILAARPELQARARLASTPMRVPALRALGMLGSALAGSARDEVFDTLVEARTDANPIVRLAAVDGLAELRDVRAAALLVGALAQGEGSSGYEAAQNGLRALGEDAWSELLRVAYSPAHRARRDAAILLAEQLVPESFSILLTLFTDAPEDEGLAWELAVLSARDHRAEPDPALAWWDWWDEVDHGDALAWFRSALAAGGLVVPASEAFAGAGTREAADLCLRVLDLDVPCLVERARRELERMLGPDVAGSTVRATDGADWRERLTERVRASFD